MRGDAAEPVDVRDIVSILWRRAWLIVAVLSLFLIVAAIGATLTAPIYAGSALVLVDPARKNLLDPATQTASSASESARLDSEVEILGSDGVLMQTILAHDLAGDPEFSATGGWRAVPQEQAMGAVLANFRSAVSVQRRGGTHVIAVSVSSVDPAKAARLANALAQTYIATQVTAKIDAVLSARDIIGRQGEEARQALVRAETEFSRYIYDNLDEIVLLTGRSDLRDRHRRVNDLAAQRAQTALFVSDLKAGLENADWSVLGARVKSDAALGFQQERERLVAALASTEPGSGGEAALKQGLAGIETMLDAAAQRELADAQALLATNEAAVAAERQALGATILNSQLPPDILAQLYGLQQVARNATAKYQALLARLQDLETEASLQVADSRVVSAALPPAKPRFPSLPLILGFAGLGGVGAGVASAFLAENLRGGFTAVRQVQAAGVSATVSLPRDGDPAAYGEAVRELRALVEAAGRARDADAELQDAPGHIVLVGSSVAGEGKTSVALALARSYAGAGRRVLVVDAGVRKADAHSGLPASAGLGPLLRGWPSGVDFERYGRRDPGSSCVVVGGGEGVADRALADGGFARLFAAARQNFDLVLVDTPALDVSADGFHLAPHADAVVFVLRWAMTPKKTVLDALERLTAMLRPGCAVVAVLNRSPARRRGG